MAVLSCFLGIRDEIFTIFHGIFEATKCKENAYLPIVMLKCGLVAMTHNKSLNGRNWH